MTRARAHCWSLVALGGAAVAACTESLDPPSRAAADDLLQALDDAFNEGRVDEFADLFAGGAAQAKGNGPLRHLLQHDRRLTQESSVALFEAVGDVGFVLADTALRCGTEGAGPVESQKYLAFEVRSGVPRFLVYEDVDPGVLMHLPKHFSGVYRCPPCNFQIGAATLDEWLVVPSPKRVAGCVEMVSFYRPGVDIRLTLSVHRNPEHHPAAEILHRLVQRMTGRIVPRSAIAAWQPPFYTTMPPAGLQGARFAGDGGDRYVVTRSTPGTTAVAPEICYLLSVCGSREARADLSEAVGTWLASFQLIESDCASNAVALASAEAHGGRCHLDPEGHFRSDTMHLQCQGPEGWRASVQAETGLFGVTYVCPDGTGKLCLTAYELPPGNDEQRRDAALRQVKRRIDASKLEVVSESPWTAVSPDQPERASMLDLESCSDPAKPSGARRRDRLLVYPDLWVHVAGRLESDAALPAFDALCRSVRRE